MKIQRVIKKDNIQVWAIIENGKVVFEYDVRSVVSAALNNNKSGSLEPLYEVIKGESRTGKTVYRQK